MQALTFPFSFTPATSPRARRTKWKFIVWIREQIDSCYDKSKRSIHHRGSNIQHHQNVPTLVGIISSYFNLLTWTKSCPRNYLSARLNRFSGKALLWNCGRVVGVIAQKTTRIDVLHLHTHTNTRTYLYRKIKFSPHPTPTFTTLRVLFLFVCKRGVCLLLEAILWKLAGVPRHTKSFS